MAPFTWGNPFTCNMQFFAHDSITLGAAPYTVGPISVVDGACHPAPGCGRYANFVLPHVRFDGELAAPTPVPEPSTLLLSAAGLAALARRFR